MEQVPRGHLVPAVALHPGPASSATSGWLSLAAAASIACGPAGPAIVALSWGTTALGYRRETFLLLQLLGVVFFALAIAVSAVLAERSRRGTLLGVSAAIAAFGLVMAPLLTAGTVGAGVSPW